MKETNEPILACPFCGQTRLDVIRNENLETGVDKKLIGALYCNCSDAQRFRAKKKSKDGLKDIIDEFAHYAESKGIAIKDADKLVLKSNAEAVIDNRFDSMTIKVDTITVKLSLDKDGALKFGVVYKYGYSQLT